MDTTWFQFSTQTLYIFERRIKEHFDICPNPIAKHICDHFCYKRHWDNVRRAGCGCRISWVVSLPNGSRTASWKKGISCSISRKEFNTASDVLLHCIKAPLATFAWHAEWRVRRVQVYVLIWSGKTAAACRKVSVIIHYMCYWWNHQRLIFTYICGTKSWQ